MSHAQKLKKTRLLDGKIVSTVRLGENVLAFDQVAGALGAAMGAKGSYVAVAQTGLPFETMVFPSDEDFAELDACRYATSDEALAGHAEMVAKWTPVKERA